MVCLLLAFPPVFFMAFIDVLSRVMANQYMPCMQGVQTLGYIKRLQKKSRNKLTNYNIVEALQNKAHLKDKNVQTAMNSASREMEYPTYIKK